MTTSYKSKGMIQLLTYLASSVRAKNIIEFGTQQGHSALALAKSGAKVKTYDSFQEKYPLHPYKETHADFKKALEETKGHNIKIIRKNVFKINPTKCDLLHIDICNHAGNVPKLVSRWKDKVSKMIILEGGIHNSWQQKYGFQPFNFYLEQIEGWKYIIIRGEGDYAMTVLTRK